MQCFGSLFSLWGGSGSEFSFWYGCVSDSLLWCGCRPGSCSSSKVVPICDPRSIDKPFAAHLWTSTPSLWAIRAPHGFFLSLPKYLILMLMRIRMFSRIGVSSIQAPGSRGQKPGTKLPEIWFPPSRIPDTDKKLQENSRQGIISQKI